MVVAANLQVSSSHKEAEDDEVANCTWVPDILKNKTEGETQHQQGRMLSSSSLQRTGGKATLFNWMALSHKGRPLLS